MWSVLVRTCVAAVATFTGGVGVLGVSACAPQTLPPPEPPPAQPAVSEAVDGDELLRLVADELIEGKARTLPIALTHAYARALGLPPPQRTNGRECESPVTLDSALQGHVEELGLIGTATLAAYGTQVGYLPIAYLIGELARAHGTDADARQALEIVAQSEHPTLTLDAAHALLDNPVIGDQTRRGLVEFVVFVEETKRARGRDGALLVPRWKTARPREGLVDRLARSSRARSRRLAAELMVEWGVGERKAIDALLHDPWWDVRAAAGGLFWKGSDTSLAEQRRQIAWFRSYGNAQSIGHLIEGKPYSSAKEYRHTQFRSDDGELVDFFLDEGAEAVGRFVGAALQAASAQTDIAFFLSMVREGADAPKIGMQALGAIERSTTMDAEQKASALIETTRFVESYAVWVESWRRAARLAIEAPNAVIANDGRGAMKGVLSKDKRDRIAALRTQADRVVGIKVALVEAGYADASDLEKPPPAVLLALLEHGHDSQFVFDRIEERVKNPGTVAATLRLYADHVDYAVAYERAVQRLDRPAQKVDAIIRFLDLVSGQNVSNDLVAPPPTEYDYARLEPHTRRLLASISEMGLDAVQEREAWRRVVLDESGTPRWRTMFAIPNDERVRKITRSILFERVSERSACWVDGQGIDLGAAMYATTPPKAMSVTVEELTRRRLDTIRKRAKEEDVRGVECSVRGIVGAHPKLVHRLDAELDRPAWLAPPRELIRALGRRGEDRFEFENELVMLLHKPDLRELNRRERAALRKRIRALAPKFEMDDEVDPWMFNFAVAFGTDYASLASEFRDRIALRWDQADLARARGGDRAALETLVTHVGSEYGLYGDSPELVENVIAAADISLDLKLPYLERLALGRGRADAATALFEIRTRSLDHVVRTAPLFTLMGSYGASLPLSGRMIADPRMRASDAVQAAVAQIVGTSAWPPTSFLDPGGAFQLERSVEMTRAICARGDVPPRDKQVVLGLLVKLLSSPRR